MVQWWVSHKPSPALTTSQSPVGMSITRGQAGMTLTIVQSM